LNNSERNIHHNLRLRLTPFSEQFGDRVVVRRDGVLVMGIDHDDLLKLAASVYFAVITRPWRMEVDMWEIIVNVDLEFLEGLDKRWLERRDW
jgi:hypothetical protein